MGKLKEDLAIRYGIDKNGEYKSSYEIYLDGFEKAEELFKERLSNSKGTILKVFSEYGIEENQENNLTKKDIEDCVEQIISRL